MLISIIMPVYNAENKVETTLQSIIDQDQTLYELIVMDNESTDQTAHIVNHYMSLYPQNIRCISEKDRGIYDAMNKGIKAASGDYLYFIGAGDCLTTDSLLQIVECEADCPDIIYGNVIMYPEGLIYGKEFSKSDILSSFLCHQQIFYNQRVFQRIGMYNTRYSVYADANLNLLCWACDSISKRYVDCVVAKYDGTGYSASNRDESYAKEIRNTIIQYYGYEDYIKYFASTGFEFVLTAGHISDLRIVIVAREWAITDIEKRITELNKKRGNNTRIVKMIIVEDFKRLSCEDSDDIDHFIICGNSMCDELLIKMFLLKEQIPENKILIGRDSVISSCIMKFADENTAQNVIIFGTGAAAGSVVSYIMNHQNNHVVDCFFDNNKDKIGTKFMGKTICAPHFQIVKDDTYIIVASMWKREIIEQLCDIGIRRDRIIT